MADTLLDLVAGREQVLDEEFDGSLPPGESLTGVEFEGCVFTGCTLAQAQLRRCTFYDCRFQDCDLAMLDLTDSRFVAITVERCRLLAVNLAALGPAALAAEPWRFVDCRLDLACFQGVDLTQARFTRCSLREADFADAVLAGATFDECDFAGATFGGTDLREANFVGSHGYLFDVRDNRVRDLRVDAGQAADLLRVFGIVVAD